MSSIPSLTLPDNSISLLTEGYPFLLKAFKKQQTDILETRLALTEIICLTGESGAKLFYDNDRFVRKGVVPDRVKSTLFGHGGVHGLDGNRHQHRTKGNVYVRYDASEHSTSSIGIRAPLILYHKAVATLIWVIVVPENGSQQKFSKYRFRHLPGT